MNVPLPEMASTRPDRDSSLTAERTVAGLTPSSAINFRTDGNLSPGEPASMRLVRCLITRLEALSSNMRSQSSATDLSRETVGLILGGIGVAIFSLTLPATRAAVPAFGGWTVGIGRAVVAALLGAILLAAKRPPRPPRRLFGRLAIVAGGVIIGFPLFTALALIHVPASRGAIVVGFLPATTAIVAAVRNGERPSPQFWLAATGGLVTVMVFAVATGAGGRPEPADGLLVLAVVSAAIGYAEGAAVTAELGGWQTISWALVLAAPVTTPIAAIALLSHGVVDPTTKAVVGLVYVCVFSMFLGFFAWYAGLGIAGVARVSQIQLVQPILTLGWAALLLDETITTGAMAAAVAVLAFVAAAKRSPVRPDSGVHTSLARSD